MSRAHANIVAGEGDESDSDDEDWLDDVDVAELTAEDIRAAGLESPFVTPHVTPKAEASNTTFGGNAVPAEVDAGTDAGTGVGTRAVPGDDAGTGGQQALSAAGGHCHDIDDSVRHLTANLAELAATGRTEWARVPEKSRPPPDIYDRALRG